jgi:hypothetical protein
MDHSSHRLQAQNQTSDSLLFFPALDSCVSGKITGCWGISDKRAEGDNEKVGGFEQKVNVYDYNTAS